MAGSVTLKTDDWTPKVALGVAAHPDDLDFGMAGTIARWASKGCEIYYLILTNGNKGSSDPDCDPAELIRCRQEEQRAAAQKLGVKDVYFHDYEDGMLEVTMDLKRDIVRAIRRVRPEAVLTMDPGMLYCAERDFVNHPDHRAAGQATLDAVFPLARDHLSFPEIARDEGLAPHKTATVLLFNMERSNYAVDVSEHIGQKMDALAAHVSQMQDLQLVQDRLKSYASDAGEAIGADYAELFQRIDIR
ncbi:MAG TPA: PIG-L deacetylase family protein [Candidatus Saccharimonadales bacterium]|jgi:LmbE family N-acetylglucosaminyl deacetylase